MLSEIILGLLGRTGDIIVQEGSAFKVNPLIKFISESDKEVMNRVVILGFYFKEISSFVEANLQGVPKFRKSFLKALNLFLALALLKTSVVLKAVFILDLLVFGRVVFHEILDEERGMREEGLPRDSEAQSVVGNSAYIRAICFGIEEILKLYEEKILSIEEDFLELKNFTLTELLSQLFVYHDVFPELMVFKERIIEDQLKGGPLIDFLYRSSMHGNTVLHNMYALLLERVNEVLYHQVLGWVGYGKIYDIFNEFFIMKRGGLIYDSESSGKAINQPGTSSRATMAIYEKWDSIFTVNYNMQPKELIREKTLEKILFLGKATMVLMKRRNLIQPIQVFEPENVKNLGKLKKFDPVTFASTIEKLRLDVSIKFMRLIIEEEDLGQHLQTLRNFYLLNRGDFFHTFIEEAERFFKLPPSSTAELEINNVVFKNSIMRMGLLEKSEVRFLRFILKKNGFSYKGFENSYGLRILGSAIHRNHVIRFPPMRKPTECSVAWHTIKQNVENGFRIFFKLQMGKLTNPRMHSVRGSSGANKGNGFCCSSLHLVIQNSREIKDDKPVPLYLHKLDEYLSVQIGVIEPENTVEEAGASYRSFVRVFLNSSQNNQSQGGAKNQGLMKIAEYIFKEEGANPADGAAHTYK